VKVIARIPALDSQAVEAPPCTDGPAESALRSGASPRRREAFGRRPGFPAVSVGLLAAVAVAVWMLASWNDGRRLARARQERMARIQAFEAATGTVAR
jgi:hypothetical protein